MKMHHYHEQQKAYHLEYAKHFQKIMLEREKRLHQMRIAWLEGNENGFPNHYKIKVKLWEFYFKNRDTLDIKQSFEQFWYEFLAGNLPNEESAGDRQLDSEPPRACLKAIDAIGEHHRLGR